MTSTIIDRTDSLTCLLLNKQPVPFFFSNSRSLEQPGLIIKTLENCEQHMSENRYEPIKWAAHEQECFPVILAL